MRRWIFAGVAAAGIVALLFLFAVPRAPVVRWGENGTFANDCCGTIALSDGKMVLNDSRTVRYTIAKDAEGPYVMPESSVGVVRDQGFEVDGTRSIVKLRLDKLPQPTRIVVYWGSVPFAFTRQAPLRRATPE
jgi:hypothetical protein